MDLETENRIAAILMKEAAELRRQAQREGALAYLRQPTVRSRPNSRFLTATVRGVQQANRVVEVSEMWRLRQKQIELDNKLRSRARNESNTSRSYKAGHESSRRSRSNCSDEPESSQSATLASKKGDIQDADRVSHEGLRDEEVDEFLHSRAKRGRGTVGSRMDETGPYLPFRPDSETESYLEKKKARVVLGPDKPRHLNQPCESELDVEKRREKRRARKGRSKRHGSREKPRHKRKKERKNA